MPHIDELFGITTLAAGGLFVAIALQPEPPAKPDARASHREAAVANAPTPSAAPTTVRLP